ncbi:GATA transcription factor 5 [Apostasia shenzhenica]|uniref:GATA transcription factor 5 n=1 Tax=Apostasia shenzhenica TaxID=1088818 RepID=A0A2I0B8T6_9ASPA|nr:GATA transcription factor 5 [Apostasia shenzhenica]
MLHQMLLSPRPFSPSPSLPCSLRHSSSAFALSAGRLLPSPPTNAFSAQGEMEDMKGMHSSALHMGFSGDEVGEAAWAAERGNLLAEEFQVEDLLDLRGLLESEEEDEDEEEDEETARVDFTGTKPKPSAVTEEEPSSLSEISLPEEPDAAHLEWLSRFFEDCQPEFQPQTFPSPAKYSVSGCQKPAPSISSSTAPGAPIKAKRSKRSRGDGAVWTRSGPPVVADSPPTSSITGDGSSPAPSSSSSSSSSSISSTYISFEPSPAAAVVFLDETPPPPKKHMPKKRGRKPKNPLAAAGSFATGDRCCTHCGVQKTPQWRAGPHGAKTLCNACGVRFKSGRLLPEYRPACSPTFVSNVHSNSHRKVLEMRRKKEEQLLPVSPPPVPSC